MPRVCTICTHPHRVTIDEELISRESFRNIAERFGTSTTALHRHKAEHLPTVLVRGQEAKEAARADDLLSQVCDLQARAHIILDKAEASDELRTALAAIREARGNLELLAKLLAFERNNRQTYTHEDLEQVMATVVDVIVRHVRDRDVLAAIDAEFAAILGKETA